MPVAAVEVRLSGTSSPHVFGRLPNARTMKIEATNRAEPFTPSLYCQTIVASPRASNASWANIPPGSVDHRVEQCTESIQWARRQGFGRLLMNEVQRAAFLKNLGV